MCNLNHDNFLKVNLGILYIMKYKKMIYVCVIWYILKIVECLCFIRCYKQQWMPVWFFLNFKIFKSYKNFSINWWDRGWIKNYKLLGIFGMISELPKYQKGQTGYLDNAVWNRNCKLIQIFSSMFNIITWYKDNL